MKKRALISVSNKTGVVEFSKALVKLGYEIISTGGTAKTLENEGIKVIGISDITGFPECLDGRVKTLHPHIHAGLLARRDISEHMNFLTSHKINTIDLVVVNLYPFKETLLNPNSTHADIIEKIDIGGPSMLRSASKNYNSVAVVVDPSDYAQVLKELEEKGNTTEETRLYLASKVFSHTAAYDSMIAGYLNEKVGVAFPKTLTRSYTLVEELRYGENPHQKAAFYENAIPVKGGLAQAKQIWGKELSFNNINDTTGAIELLKEFTRPTVVAVKHSNACAVASADDVFTAYKHAYDADPVSIFGGIIAINRKVDRKTAEKINEIFVEIVIAPEFDESAIKVLQQKKNIRLLVLEEIAAPVEKGFRVNNVYGGMLLQGNNVDIFDKNDLKVVTKKVPTQKEMDDMEFAFRVVKHIKSNAIVLANNQATVGIGVGQVNRIWATELAIKHSIPTSKGAVMASDAFFPFPDCVEAAAAAGITAIIQPGGSLNDKLSVDKCDELGIAMVTTGKRHFRH